MPQLLTGISILESLSAAKPLEIPVCYRTPVLRFSENGNAKLPFYVASFSLPSGHTCPGAKDCLAKRNLNTGKISTGKHAKYRCFSASQEIVFANVWEIRKGNFDELRRLKTTRRMAWALTSAIPQSPVIRIHVGGDFFSQGYFDAWILVARRFPDKLFYAYTKSLKFWVTRLGRIPENLVLTASRGGIYDRMIDEHGLREAVVVFHPEEAVRKGLEIDHDDSHAMRQGPSFALLIHGTQPKGSRAAGALIRMKKENITYKYSNKNGKRKSNRVRDGTP